MSHEATPPAGRLACAMCRRPFAPGDVKLELGLAFCATCNTVRDLPANAAEVEAGSADVAPAPPKARAAVRMPEGLRVEHFEGTLLAKWKVPWGPPVVALLFLGVLLAYLRWDIGARVQAFQVLAAASVPLALGLAYLAVANFLNHTTLEVRAGKVLVGHGPVPVPWRRSRTLGADRIAQLFARRYAEGDETRYELVARLRKDGGDVCVIKGLTTPEQALYLEQVVEQHLGLVDHPVPGELPQKVLRPP